MGGCPHKGPSLKQGKNKTPYEKITDVKNSKLLPHKTLEQIHESNELNVFEHTCQEGEKSPNNLFKKCSKIKPVELLLLRAELLERDKHAHEHFSWHRVAVRRVF